MKPLVTENVTFQRNICYYTTVLLYAVTSVSREHKCFFEPEGGGRIFLKNIVSICSFKPRRSPEFILLKTCFGMLVMH
jgi:hypothetical protein